MALRVLHFLLCMTIVLAFLFDGVIPCAQKYSWILIDRDSWGALPRTHPSVEISDPVPYVIIHHTAYPRQCFGVECKNAVQELQKYHLALGWSDIGYNFVIGSDGNIYEGRGWGIVGAHAKGYNKISCGIAFIGDFDYDKPEDVTVESVRWLINQGLEEQRISKNYSVIGHRDVGQTTCPGKHLYSIISKWDQLDSPS